MRSPASTAGVAVFATATSAAAITFTVTSSVVLLPPTKSTVVVTLALLTSAPVTVCATVAAIKTVTTALGARLATAQGRLVHPPALLLTTRSVRLMGALSLMVSGAALGPLLVTTMR